MQLIFRNRHAAMRLAWCQYALLRDNVQHYLESGPEQRVFAALHAVERVVDGEPGTVAALELRGEVQRAWCALANLKLAESAVSLRTHAFLNGCEHPPPVRGTVIASLTGWSLPVVGDEELPLRLYIADFVAGLLTITERAAVTDSVSVTRF